MMAFFILFSATVVGQNRVEYYFGRIYVCTVPEMGVRIRVLPEIKEDEFYCGTDGRFRDIIRSETHSPFYVHGSDGSIIKGAIENIQNCIKALEIGTTNLVMKYADEGLYLTFVCDKKTLDVFDPKVYNSFINPPHERI
jgi:hypothetical protein